MEAAPLLEVRGSALYPPFKKGCVQCEHTMPGNELGWKSVGGMPPSNRCSVVDIANVPHDHRGMGAS